MIYSLVHPLFPQALLTVQSPLQVVAEGQTRR